MGDLAVAIIEGQLYRAPGFYVGGAHFREGVLKAVGKIYAGAVLFPGDTGNTRWNMT